MPPCILGAEGKLGSCNPASPFIDEAAEAAARWSERIPDTTGWVFWEADSEVGGEMEMFAREWSWDRHLGKGREGKGGG